MYLIISLYMKFGMIVIYIDIYVIWCLM